jgi:hypothetical protein
MSKSGQCWDSEIEPAFQRDNNIYTAQQYYMRYGNSILSRGDSVGTSFIPKKHCGERLKLDHNGMAYCQICQKIFNSGNPKDGDRVLSVPQFKEWGPPTKRRVPRRWANAGRTTSAAP